MTVRTSLCAILMLAASTFSYSADVMSTAELGDVRIGKTVLRADEEGRIVCGIPDQREAEAMDRRSVDLHVLAPNRAKTTQAGKLNIELRGTAQLEANPAAKALFLRAAETWEAIIDSSVTVVIDVDYGTTRFGEPWSDPSPLGSASGQNLGSTGNYSAIRSALIAKASDDVEQALYAKLPNGSVPTDQGSVSTVYAPTSTLRALGLIPAVANPATEPSGWGSPPSIGFNSAFKFDLNPDNGVTVGQYDFLSVAIHEIGHILGFTSWVGLQEFDPTFQPILSLVDVFRLRPGATNNSFATSPRITTPGGSQVFYTGSGEYSLSTGNLEGENGDGNQASHWKADDITGNYIGIMDPTIAPGVKQAITSADKIAFDRIGWQLVAASGGSCQAHDVSCGTTFSGTLASDDCQTSSGQSYYEWVRVNLIAGQKVTVSMTATGFDPYFAILGPAPSYTTLGESLFGGAITVTATESGVHYIQATSRGIRQSGSYSISVTCSSTTASCTPSSTVACMLNNRFKVTVRYRNQFDNNASNADALKKNVTGFANPSFETAFFYFNSENNIEAMVKMLDQGNTNGAGQPTIAVLTGSATPLRAEVTIVDTKTGASKKYTSEFGKQQGVTDFTAFVK